MYVWDTKSPEPLNDAQLGDFLLPERQRSRARGVEPYLKPALSQSDLLDRWQLQLAHNAPNRFVINVQDDQITPVREFIAAQAAQAGITARMTIRYVAGITPKMRVVHGADIYNIEAVLPDPTLRRHLTLMVSTGVNNG